MNNLESFSLCTNLAISAPQIQQDYFPFDFDFSKSILILNTFEDPQKDSRVYDYFQDVIDFSKENLALVGYEYFQPLTGKETKLNCKNSGHVLTVNQISYLIEQCALVITNDGLYPHLANSMGVPCVTLYGPSMPENRAPKFNRSLITNIRKTNKVASYISKESPKTINEIKPENVIREVYSSLGLLFKCDLTTVYSGRHYPMLAIEALPDAVINPSNFQDKVITFRLDYLFNESGLFENLKYRKCNVVTDKEINLDAVKHFKENIPYFNLEVNEETSLDYCRDLIKTGVKTLFFTRLNGEKLSRLRMKFFDLGIVEEVVVPDQPKLKDGVEYKYKTNKILLSDGLVYTSFGQYLKKNPVPSLSGSVSVFDREDKYLAENIEFLTVFS